jgi:glycosyltransferase involved in cell wall biosynthesis
MKVLLAIASIQAATGGPAAQIAHLAGALRAAGVVPEIACQVLPEHGPEIGVDPGVGIHRFPAGWPLRYAPGRHLRRLLRTLCRHHDLVHNFGLWMAINRYTTGAAVQAGKRMLLSPQGMLEANALGRSALAKRMALALWVRKDILKATCLHATGDLEYESIRKTGFTSQPIAVIPNGVTLPTGKEIAERSELETIWPWLSGRQYVLFLGRIHPFKNLIGLVRAWQRSGVGSHEILLVLAGPDLEGHGKEVSAVAHELGVGDQVRFVGPVDGRVKLGLLATAAVLVLPSRSENFGFVVAEALACGTPAIANTDAPWRTLNEAGCGWWIEPGEEPLASTLREALSVDPEHRRLMGLRGRQLAEERLAWSVVATQMKAVYEWLLGGGSPPCTVRMD